MKILICTQIVDRTDAALGFFHGWIEQFALHTDHVHVICLKEGKHTFPKHVKVHSLGKEKGAVSKFIYALRFYRLAWKLRHEYDGVLVHMNPEYVVLGGLLWRLLGKRVGLWYTHRTVDLKLKLAALFMHHGFTGSVESFRLKNPKIIVTGQGVDVSLFVPATHRPNRPLTLVVVGRIAPVKNLELAIDMLRELRKDIVDAELVVVGVPLKEEDMVYEKDLKKRIQEYGLGDAVHMIGGKDAAGVRGALQEADVFLHTSMSNSADKTAVEAMATGLYLLTSSPVYVKDIPPSCAQPADSQAYAQEIRRYWELGETEKKILSTELRSAATERHSLNSLTRFITTTLS